MCNCNKHKKQKRKSHRCKGHKGADLRLLSKTRNLMNQQDPIQFENEFAIERGRGATPPDTHLAVGPGSIMTIVNNMVAIYTKDTKQQLYRDSATEFFSANSPFDGWVMYDEFSRRFFYLAISDIEVPGTRQFNLAVSTSSNPKGINDFHKYFWIDNDPGFFSLDYPKMAIDREAVYITWEDGGIIDGQPILFYPIIAFNTNSLVSGSSPTEMVPIFLERVASGSPFGPAAGEFIFPCQPHKSCNGVEKVLLINVVGTGDFFDFYTINKLKILQVKNVLTNPVLVSTELSVPEWIGISRFISLLSDVPQPPPVINAANEPILGLNTLADLFMSGTIRNNSLWTCNSIFHFVDGSDEPLKIVQWFEIDVSDFLNGGDVSLKQTGRINPGNRVNMIYPSINVDKHENMAITFPIAGELQYPAVAYTGRLKCDPKGTVRLPLQIAEDPNLYFQVAPTGTNRYGDYTGIVVDPCDQETFYFHVQYPYPADPEYLDTNDFKIFGFGSMWTTLLAGFKVKKCGKSINAPQKNVIETFTDGATVSAKITHNKGIDENKIEKRKNKWRKKLELTLVKVDEAEKNRILDIYDKAWIH